MELLDLPIEILRAIIETCARVNGPKETLGIRLVCKLFNIETIRAICATKALHPLESGTRCKDEYLLSEYLLARTLEDHARRHHLSVVIADTVDYIFQQGRQDKTRRLEYVQALCTATVKACINCPCCGDTFKLLNPKLRGPKYRVIFRHDLIENALAASIYLGIADLFKKLISDGAKNVHTYFGRPFDLAAGRDDINIARLILDKEIPTPEVRRDAILSAGLNGWILAIQLLFEPKYSANIDDAHEWNIIEWVARRATEVGHQGIVCFLVQQAGLRGLLDTPRRTTMWEFNSVIKRPPVAELYDLILWHAALRGHEELARLALDNGANPNARKEPHNGSLLGAHTALDATAKNGHEMVVQLLIAKVQL